jgi:hypothetical protein
VEGDAGHAQSSCLGEDSLGGNIPLVVPAVIVAGGDAIDGGHDFAKLAGTLAAGTEGALGLIPKLDIVREKWIFGLVWHRNRSVR